MKRVLVIFILSTYLCSTTELGQLLKTPVLVSHFFEHKSDDVSITFWSYLVHHYGGHEKDADWDTDMKLPFMQQSETLNLMTIAAKDVAVPKRSPAPRSRILFAQYADGFIPNSYLDAIWQPPKSC